MSANSILHPIRIAVVAIAGLLAVATITPKAEAHGIHGFPGGIIAGAIIGSILHHTHRHRGHKHRSHRHRSRQVRELGYKHRHCRRNRCGFHWHSMSRPHHRRH